MDVFPLRDQLVADYEAFTRSVIHVSDDRIREVVDRELAEGVLDDANRAMFRRGRRWNEQHPVSESIPQDELFRSTGVRP